jgi:hypothetical protein
LPLPVSFRVFRCGTSIAPITLMARITVRGVQYAALSLIGLLYGCGGGGGGAEPSAETEASALVAVCAATPSLPAGAWQCGFSLEVECDSPRGSAGPDRIYVVRDTACDDQSLLVTTGPFGVGAHEVVVSERVPGVGGDPATSLEVCRSSLTVVDTTPPQATPLNAELWPPNHKLHSFTAQQCAAVVDRCDPQLSVRFTSASSDEPVDAKGDGSTEPDIVFDGAERVSLRSERQGGSNGRVYTLGWAAVDASGNESEGTCRVVVPHDGSGREAIADAPAYTVVAPR